MRIIKEGYTNLAKEKEFLELRMNVILQYQDHLKKEKNNLEILLKRNQEIQEKIKKSLESLKGIENNLYKSIIIEGIPVTKAVDKASFLFDLDPSTIWKSYYPNVKKLIEELHSSDFPVTSK